MLTVLKDTCRQAEIAEFKLFMGINVLLFSINTNNLFRFPKIFAHGAKDPNL